MKTITLATKVAELTNAALYYIGVDAWYDAGGCPVEELIEAYDRFRELADAAGVDSVRTERGEVVILREHRDEIVIIPPGRAW